MSKSSELMPDAKADLRVIKTHKAIRGAMIELLEEMPFEKITVQDILARALVNRSTFYKYYSGKSDLAGAMIADFKADYADVLHQRFDGKSLPELLDEIPSLLESFRRPLLALWKINTRRHHLYQDMFLMIEQKYLQYAKQLPAKHGADNLPYQAHLAATLMMASMRYHFENKLEVNTEQVRRNLAQMVAVMTATK